MVYGDVPISTGSGGRSSITPSQVRRLAAQLKGNGATVAQHDGVFTLGLKLVVDSTKMEGYKVQFEYTDDT